MPFGSNDVQTTGIDYSLVPAGPVRLDRVFVTALIDCVKLRRQ